MKKILLIEDNRELRENTAEILELANYIVFVAENGKVGVDIALAEIPDLIICDIMMPVLDGYGVLHLLSSQETTRGIPFIFLTARTEKSDYRKGMEMGADDYIMKPFDDIELLKAVETRLKKADMLRESFAVDSKSFGEFIDKAQRYGGLALTSELRDVHTYKKKQFLYSEGNHPHYVYYVVKGKVKSYLVNDDGKEMITSIYGPGDFIGYTTVLENTPHKDNAETLEESELMVIPAEDFMSLLHSDRVVSEQFIRLLTKDVLEKEEKLMSIAYNSLRKRIAGALIDLSEKFLGTNETGTIEISRENLARVVGTAKESLVRTLSDFKDEKLIEIVDGKIHIINSAKLKNLPY